MINAIIIDDESHSAKALQFDIEMHCPEVNVCCIANSGIEGIKKIRELSPDVIFLDVEMQDMNGFEMLEILGSSLSSQVIFTTAYAQFAVRALRINALDYLLKPIDEMELKQAVKRTGIISKKNNENNERVHHAINNLKLPAEEQRIALPNRDGYDFVAPLDILYCKADGAYTQVYLTDGRIIMLSKSLGEVETVLPSSSFIRIHHSFTVNINHISKLRKSDGSVLVMANGDELGIARSKKDQLFKRMGLIAK